MTTIVRDTRLAQPWWAHLAAACCYLGAAWIAVSDGIATPGPQWLAPAFDFPWYSAGLALAGLWWLRVGMRDKGWVHLVAAVLLALPKIYSLPTDLFGVAPGVVLSLAIGVYLHVSLGRDHARLQTIRARGMAWAVVIVLALMAVHVLVSLTRASISANFLALG